MKNTDFVRIMTDAKNKSGKTQQDIAEATGYSVSSISRFFSGKMEDVPMEFLEDMATCLGLSMADIFAPAGQKQSKHEPIVELLREMLSTREQEYRDTVAALKEKHGVTIRELKEAHRDEIGAITKAHVREVTSKDRWITLLAILCGLCVAAVVIMMIAAIRSPNIELFGRIGP